MKKRDFSQNHTPLLLAIAHSGVQTINSIESFLYNQDKPFLYGKLLQVQKKLGGYKNFPLIEQTYFPNYKSMYFLPSFPTVGIFILFFLFFYFFIFVFFIFIFDFCFYFILFFYFFTFNSKGWNCKWRFRKNEDIKPRNLGRL